MCVCLCVTMCLMCEAVSGSLSEFVCEGVGRCLRLSNCDVRMCGSVCVCEFVCDGV